jgi:hypothetical protein
VKEIVQGHGGSVRFDSAVGSGTTFFLHLPEGAEAGAALGGLRDRGARGPVGPVSCAGGKQ